MQEQAQKNQLSQGTLAQTITLQEFKQKVEQHLLKISGNKDAAQKIMKMYESDWQTLWDENWSVETCATGMMMGFI